MECLFRNPAAGQQRQAAFGLYMFDDLQLNPMFGYDFRVVFIAAK
jgi:hypothetical protein